MEKSFKEIKAVHSSSLIIIIIGENVEIYNEDAKIIEYLSNLISNSKILTIKNKYLESIEKILKNKKINYIIFDKNNEYRVYDYYNNKNNKYEYYLNKSKKYNKFRKCFILIYNFIFGLPSNRYK